jgi:superfamily II DNA or RNA helicase
MELTERILNDAGGWQIMKQARALHEMGRVGEATWAEPLLQGRVREGESEYRSGLKILSKSNIENLCSCRMSRHRGAICAHSVAVGLQVLKPQVAPETAVAAMAAGERPQAKAVPNEELRPKFSLEDGESIRLHVILPPNVAAQWNRGAVTCGIEAEFDGGRRALASTLPGNGSFRVDHSDLRLVAVLRQLANGTVPGTAIIPQEQFIALLSALSGNQRVTFGRGSAASIDDIPARPKLLLEAVSSGAVRVHAQLREGQALLHSPSASWILDGTTFRPVAPGLLAGYRDVLAQDVVIPAVAAAAFLQRELPLLSEHFEISGSIPELSEHEETGKVSGEPARIALELEGSLNHLVGKLLVRYGDHGLTLSSKPERTSYRRDFDAERDAVARLQRSGFSGPDGQGQFVLKGEPRILSFFARDLPGWERDAEVAIGSRFQHVTRDVDRVHPHLEIRPSGENWFELQVELASSSGERFSSSEIQRLLQSGQTHVKRKNGRIAVFDPGMLDEFQQVLQDCDPQQKQPGVYRIERRQAAYLGSIAAEQGAQIHGTAEWQSWSRGAGEIEALKPIALGSLEEALRPYQKQGVYWMNFLAKNGLGGVLADEMGLGKTVQALALLRALGGKALVVCPSSLVYNWEREAAKFTPDRRCLAIEGSNRQALFGKPLADADLVVTSYALIRRDLELYRNTEFAAAVLDEAHHIKNPETQNAQAAFSIRAEHRFALTGTPIENSLRDIWSLMHFLMPGYLGSRNDFRERYEKPVATDPAGPEQQRLIKRLRPFILRRTKKKVASELPDKIVQVSYCELTEAQKQVYAELLSSARRQASELAGSKDQGKRRIAVLTALLRLRQACCDLRLLGDLTTDADQASAKLELLGELLSEAIDGGHRVLVFSQFVTMLQLAREKLIANGIESCYLDGSTKDRGREVDRFQNGDAPVFLISLKAGGTGLNLTAADTVVHFDPWWNPAVEDQATDRAHRIGQEKVVTAYKLIARGTVEEKILSLQAKKRELGDLAVESEQPLMQALDTAELEELLR